MSAGSAPATKPFRRLLRVHPCYGRPARGVAVRPFASKAPAVSLPLRPLRLLLAGATVARWEWHPLKNDALARRTAIQSSFQKPLNEPVFRPAFSRPPIDRSPRL